MWLCCVVVVFVCVCCVCVCLWLLLYLFACLLCLCASEFIPGFFVIRATTTCVCVHAQPLLLVVGCLLCFGLFLMCVVVVFCLCVLCLVCVWLLLLFCYLYDYHYYYYHYWKHFPGKRPRAHSSMPRASCLSWNPQLIAQHRRCELTQQFLELKAKSSLPADVPLLVETWPKENEDESTRRDHKY